MPQTLSGNTQGGMLSRAQLKPLEIALQEGDPDSIQSYIYREAEDVRMHLT